MKNTIYKILLFIIQKTSIMVGGQAVIEGVMMRVPGYYATAVRSKESKIMIDKHRFISLVEKYNLEKIPIIRGFCHLIDSMKIGFQSLDWSSKISEDDSTSNNKFIDFLLSLFSIFFAISLFMGIPYYLTQLSLNAQSDLFNNSYTFNIIAGLLRLIIFILYLYILSHLKDIKRLFAYHGAEHKVVYNFEAGQKLTVNNAKLFSTKHPRCGTSFVFILMLVTIITYSIIDGLIQYIFNFEFTIFSRISIHLLFLPIVTGVGYEILKFLARHQNKKIFYLFSKPGLWLQKITTNEPSDKQLEVALSALQSAFGDKIKDFQGTVFQADAI